MSQIPLLLKQFLECILDLADGKLSTAVGKAIPLNPLCVGMLAAFQADKTIQENLDVEAEGKMEIMANLSAFGEGTKLVEDHSHK